MIEYASNWRRRWAETRKAAPALRWYTTAAILATGVFVVLSEKETRWLVGAAVLGVFGVALVAARDKKLFLMCALLASLVVRTTINLWMPGPTAFPTGSGTTTTAVELLACDPALFLLAGYLLFTRRKNGAAWFWKTDALAVLFLVFCSTSLINSAYPGLTLVRLPVMMRMPLIYFCFSRGITSRREVRILSLVIVCLVGLESGLAIAQTELGTIGWLSDVVKRDDQVTTVTLYGVEVARATGTIGYTTVFAQWLGLLAPMSLAIALFVRERLDRLAAAAAYIVALAALVLSLSRAEWINLPLVGAIFFAVMIAKRKDFGRRPIIIAVLLLIVAAVVVALNYNLIAARLTAPDSDSAYIRIPMMALAKRVIVDNPIFGVGLHNYTQTMHAYGAIRGSDFGVHNSFLYMWAEIGVFGLLTVLTLWTCTLARLTFCVLRDHTVVSAAAVGMFGGLVALLLHSLVEEGFHVHQVLNLTLWAYFGIAAAMKAIVIRTSANEARR